MSSSFVKNFAMNGHVGVSFFFILSGFVLAASNLEKLERFSLSGSLVFYWKRVARIVPLWAVASAPFIILALKNSDPNLIPFLSFSQAWSPDVHVSFALLAVAWTLSVEMFFYFMFPFIAALLRPFRGRSLGPILIVVGLSIPAAGALYYWLHPELANLGAADANSPHRWLYRFPVTRLGEFIAGIGVFVSIQRYGITMGRLASVSALAIAVGVLFAFMGLMEQGKAFWVMPYAVIFSVIVLILAQLEMLELRISWKLPILLGEASFAFYLIHQFYFKNAYLPTMSSFSGLPVAQVVVFLMAVSASIGLHLLIEGPARDLLLRALHIRSTMPKAVVIETASDDPSAKNVS